MCLPPFEVFTPGDTDPAALVSLKRYAAAQVLCDTPAPPGLVNRAVDGFQLVPALFGHDFRKVARAE